MVVHCNVTLGCIKIEHVRRMDKLLEQMQTLSKTEKGKELQGIDSINQAMSDSRK